MCQLLKIITQLMKCDNTESTGFSGVYRTVLQKSAAIPRKMFLSRKRSMELKETDSVLLPDTSRVVSQLSLWFPPQQFLSLAPVLGLHLLQPPPSLPQAGFPHYRNREQCGRQIDAIGQTGWVKCSAISGHSYILKRAGGMLGTLPNKILADS